MTPSPEQTELEKALEVFPKHGDFNNCTCCDCVVYRAAKSHLHHLQQKGGDVSHDGTNWHFTPNPGDMIQPQQSPEQPKSLVGATTKHLQSCIDDCQNSRVKDQLAVIVGNATVGKVCDMAQLWLNHHLQQKSQESEDTSSRAINALKHLSKTNAFPIGIGVTSKGWYCQVITSIPDLKDCYTTLEQAIDKARGKE